MPKIVINKTCLMRWCFQDVGADSIQNRVSSLAYIPGPCHCIFRCLYNFSKNAGRKSENRVELHFSFIIKTISILNPNKNMVCFKLQPPVSAIFFA